MRILLAIGSLDIGGTERQMVRLATELDAVGHDVTVLTITTGDGPLRGRLDAAGVGIWDLDLEGLLSRTPAGRIRPVETIKLWWCWVHFAWRLARARPDVVHAFLFWSYVLVLPAAWLARVPVRLSGRRNMGTEKAAHRLYPWLERLADACSTGAVANADAVADVIRRDTGLDEADITVIHNGIDLPEPADAVASQPPTAVVLANLIDYKGHADLVTALAGMDDPPRVDCYGDGPQREALEAQIAAAGLDDVVSLRGRVDDAARFYRHAQLAILASHEEGLPNAVLEAMAAGLPVVATAVGGTPELVDDGRTGLLVPAHDPGALAAAINELANGPEKRQRLGAAGRQRVADHYSWQRCVEAHERRYRRGSGHGLRDRNVHARRDPV